MSKIRKPQEAGDGERAGQEAVRRRNVSMGTVGETTVLGLRQLLGAEATEPGCTVTSTGRWQPMAWPKRRR